MWSGVGLRITIGRGWVFRNFMHSLGYHCLPASLFCGFNGVTPPILGITLLPAWIRVWIRVVVKVIVNMYFLAIVVNNVIRNCCQNWDTVRLGPLFFLVLWGASESFPGAWLNIWTIVRFFPPLFMIWTSVWRGTFLFITFVTFVVRFLTLSICLFLLLFQGEKLVKIQGSNLLLMMSKTSFLEQKCN